MKRKKFFLSIISLLLVFVFTITSSIPVEALSSASEKSIRSILSNYESWYDTTWKESGESIFLSYICPKEDLSFNQIFNYMNDIHNLVWENIGDRSAIVNVYFPFSTKKFKNESTFEKSMDEFRMAYWQFYSYGAGVEYADIVPTTGQDKNGKYLYFGVDIQLHFHPETKAYMKKLRKVVQSGKSQTSSDEALAKYFYDYICENVDYEMYYVNPSDYYEGSSHDALMYGKGVCQDMSFLFYDLCTEAGIPVIVCVNNGVNHAWNQVRLGGKWYYVDQTGFVKSKSGNYGWTYYSEKGQHVTGVDYYTEKDMDYIKHSFKSKYTDPIYRPEVRKKLSYMQHKRW